ncbi:hypothetical protein AAEX37_02217 [Oligella sp. MSHR50489EDL]|uniref:CgeB family protein n=1 Tax=Oligella sp. MSHR50489EDL TaxID=3139409 RepID=UPI003D817F07
MNEIEKIIQQVEQQAAELQKLRKALQAVNAEQKEKQTLSYQLGYIILNDTKSISGFFKVPSKLFNLYRQSRARKANKALEKSLNTQQVLSASSINRMSIDGITKLTKGLTLLDPISELCWHDAFTGFPISRAEFENQIKTSTSQFAFFESAWRANHSKWLYAFTSPGLQHSNAQALLKVIELLKSRGLPIVFWNKEDPMHYEMFKPIAKHADYIFTTDALIVNKYKQELGNQKVYPLSFAAPVKKTNPLGRFSLKSETICFAGTYYAKNHENRKKQMDMLLPVLLENNGAIYDRASKEEKEEYAYPVQYRGIIRPAVDFEQMVKLYKKFQVFLNVNTITQSSTMMSRRVYELLASGTPVISTPSKAITEQFPGIVLTVNNEQEAKLAAKKLLTDSYFWHKQSMLGIREVMHRHTYEQRWGEVESAVIGKERIEKKAEIRVICIYHGYIDLEFFVESIAQQKNVNISEIIIIHSDKLDVDDEVLDKFKAKSYHFRNFKVKDYIGKSPEIDYTFITDDRVYNFANSVWGMSLAFKYADAPAIIRSHYYKLSNLNNIYNYEINSPNWYVFMREAPTSCVLIDDKKSQKVVINLDSKKIKTTNKEPSILMVDPFNLVSLDDRENFESTSALQHFVYKAAPYLGV